MNKNQYLGIFIDEAKEHLLSLNDCLMELEKDPGNSSVLNEIFRVAHTLKGMAGTMGFNRMAKLTHDMEDVLHALRSNEIMLSSELIDILFDCMDALEEYLDNIVGTGDEGENDYNEIIQALNSALSKKGGENKSISTGPTGIDGGVAGKSPNKGVQGPNNINFEINQYEASVIKKAYDMGMKAFNIKIVLNKGCVLKSARAFIIFQTLEKYSEIIRCIPKVEDIEDERFDFEFSVIVVTKETAQTLAKALDSISELDDVQIDEITPEIAGVNNDLDENNRSVRMASSSAGEQGENEEQSGARGSLASSKNKVSKTVRVDIERLDVLMNLVGELIITKTRLKGLNDVNRMQEYNETIEYLERITTGLNDAVMKVRMVPVEVVFSRFPKMVRSISKELGKEIELEMVGVETELDKTLIDEIGDPLVHLIRNSVDHGIELPEKRRQAGKPETGHIVLRAYQESNNVVIEVEDDGQGMDIERIRQKAVEKGFVEEETARKLSDKEVIDLLFTPSFSTAEKITDLSGRGVGLDVVRTKIEALGGFVEVESEFGKGSKFIIRLPLTLAIIQALLIMVGNEKYAIPLGSINRIVEITEHELKYVQKQEVLLLGNVVIPVIRLDRVLEVPREASNQKKNMTVVIIKRGEKQYGLLVDSVIGQQEIVQKPLGKLLAGIRLVTGATIMGDGSVALILDINSLI